MNTLSPDNNFLAIEAEYSNYENSGIVILPAGYEHTVSYGGGTAKGPEAILKASAYVEFYDDEFDRELCFDKGIATLNPVQFCNLADKDALDLIETNIVQALSDNKFVVTLGGEHTISIATISAHFKKYPDISLLHFDAHSDLRYDYEGSLYSHASFLSRTAEFFPAEKITQVGIRAQCKEESVFIREKGIKTFYASAIRRGLHGNNWQEKVVGTLGNQIYVTFDIDYFDPSLIPSTGTPEPDGFMYNETLDIFREIKKQSKKIVGFDVVELAPIDGLHHPDLTTARLVYKLLNYSFYNR